MKKLIIIGLITGLGFVSCRKESVVVDEEDKETNEYIIVGGKKFYIDWIREEISKEEGVSNDDLIYDPIDTTFYRQEYNNAKISISKFLKHQL